MCFGSCRSERILHDCALHRFYKTLASTICVLDILAMFHRNFSRFGSMLLQLSMTSRDVVLAWGVATPIRSHHLSVCVYVHVPYRL